MDVFHFGNSQILMGQGMFILRTSMWQLTGDGMARVILSLNLVRQYGTTYITIG